MHKFNIIISSPILILLSSISIWSFNIQIDSVARTSNLPIDIVKNDTFIIRNDFFFFDISSKNLCNSPDSLDLLINMDLLNHRLSNEYIFQNLLTEQWRIKEQLTNYVKFKNDLALKSDLGVFGQVLGNAKNITAIILAILHVIKYRKGLY